mmetsp:Transcript_24022/g.61164  ORF Transcript_24022/g.61164 Transcript_24022/m.61164 type:complete len:375 (+) Transcript_24022:102-1226(+)
MPPQISTLDTPHRTQDTGVRACRTLHALPSAMTLPSPQHHIQCQHNQDPGQDPRHESRSIIRQRSPGKRRALHAHHNARHRGGHGVVVVVVDAKQRLAHLQHVEVLGHVGAALRALQRHPHKVGAVGRQPHLNVLLAVQAQRAACRARSLARVLGHVHVEHHRLEQLNLVHHRQTLRLVHPPHDHGGRALGPQLVQALRRGQDHGAQLLGLGVLQRVDGGQHLGAARVDELRAQRAVGLRDDLLLGVHLLGAAGRALRTAAAARALLALVQAPLAARTARLVPVLRGGRGALLLLLLRRRRLRGAAAALSTRAARLVPAVPLTLALPVALTLTLPVALPVPVPAAVVPVSVALPVGAGWGARGARAARAAWAAA